jgi:hypothetical protein
VNDNTFERDQRTRDTAAVCDIRGKLFSEKSCRRNQIVRVT